MATQENTGPTVAPHGAAMGVTVAAGVILILAGAFGMIQGIVGLLDDNFYVVGQKSGPRQSRFHALRRRSIGLLMSRP